LEIHAFLRKVPGAASFFTISARQTWEIHAFLSTPT